jgi:uncharacterized protein YciI
MLFLARITNKEGVDELKRTHYGAHIDYLKRLDTSVLLSASAQETADAPPHELVWIISAESADEARRIVEEDPFWISGVRRDSHISLLRKSIPERRALI